jgi:methionyl-tRNA formyltransferase
VNLRVVFMGTPEFSVPTLVALRSNFHIAGVVTQPDKPRGRGLKTIPTAVKKMAVDLELPVIEPARIAATEVLETLHEWNPNIIVVAAYGKILPEIILNLPSRGCVNLHASLLPRHRGASPISGAILAGDTVTGVCTILMDSGMDTGDILLKAEIPVSNEDTAGTLHDKLMERGAALVVDTLRAIEEGTIRRTPQDHSLATYTRPVSKTDAAIDWSSDAQHLGRLVRAMNPWPGAFFELSGEAIRVWKATPEQGKTEPGQVLSLRGDGILVGAGDGMLLLREVQAPSRNRVAAIEFARARGLKIGADLR